VQQLTNLAALPPAGFRVAFFPLKIANASAAPARVVAFVDE
jgi:kynurenine formamidase